LPLSPERQGLRHSQYNDRCLDPAASVRARSFVPRSLDVYHLSVTFADRQRNRRLVSETREFGHFGTFTPDGKHFMELQYVLFLVQA